ncbi:TniB family NTP-binding protein [Rhizobium laguerreae]|nr:TniB family NTP-binding protein [Rhizobium laguerreae]
MLSQPPRDRMPCLLVYGDTGMGKTKIIRNFYAITDPLSITKPECVPAR